ncbi:MAG: glycosyltransferase family 2 protein [Candidatus Anaerobiospirillum merdipullorum]|uniref:Glycosyltransferase family 2 protein n=1 Tax=Candidatus Anaerobiospirillum merdipullorum TaxID=2838450 RepID=A0A9E2NRW6_9GAMM|nr:glycosyltransferase family 2 protein [Candidatus Anaerobiospirillum merdipullorum]
MLKLCALVPCYRHGALIAPVLQQLKQQGLAVVVVDDGCEGADKAALHAACAQAGVKLLQHPYNQGKGAAFMTGMQAAIAHGYTHLLQVDADGQHDLNYLPQLIAKAEQYPQAVISALQIFGPEAPKARVYGRQITNFWVMVETLSTKLKESMCGMRIYPLAATAKLASQVHIGRGMDFDIEILVRLFWQGLDVHYVKVPVHYRQDNSSNFHPLRDNLKISWLHTRLCCAMPWHLKALLGRKLASRNLQA